MYTCRLKQIAVRPILSNLSFAFDMK